jgi:hypothetical protein
VIFFFEIGSHKNIFRGLASNHDPPDLCLLSSWDYRYEPPVPGHTVLKIELEMG